MADMVDTVARERVAEVRGAFETHLRHHADMDKTIHGAIEGLRTSVSGVHKRLNGIYFLAFATLCSIVGYLFDRLFLGGLHG